MLNRKLKITNKDVIVHTDHRGNKYPIKDMESEHLINVCRLIVNHVNNIEDRITNRTITLNFIVMKGIPVDVEYLMRLGLNPEKFTVKLIPLNKTKHAEENNLETYANYENYEDLVKLEEKFKKEGIPVVIDAIAKCEEAGLCCGQLAQLYSK